MTDEKETKKKGNAALGCLMAFGYSVLMLWAFFVILSSLQFVPSYQLWLLLLLIIGFPLLLRKIRGKELKHRYPVGWVLVVMIISMITLQFMSKSTPEYKAYIKKEQAEEREDNRKKWAEKRAKREEAEQKALQAEARITHQKGESFKVGYMRYMVKGKAWKKQLDPYGFSEADARYLLVRIHIKNEDAESRMISGFSLIDENGSVYEQSSARLTLKDGLFLNSLNPGVEKKSTLVFDVPPEHKYKLKVDGGFWSRESRFVPLNY